MMLFQFIVLQVIVFSAVIFFMKKILTSDTQAAVGRLDSTYQDLLNKQKELNEKIEEAEKEYQAKKEEAGQIIEKYKQDANQEMHKKRDEIIKEAKSQADEMTARAKANIEDLQAKLEREVRAKQAQTCSNLLRDAMKEKTQESFHAMILDDFIERAKDFDLSKVSSQIETVTVKTAYKITEEQKAKINAFISGKLNRSLKIEEIVDDELIAGVLLQFGSLLLDGSLANSIQDVAADLKEKINLGQ